MTIEVICNGIVYDADTREKCEECCCCNRWLPISKFPLEPYKEFGYEAYCIRCYDKEKKGTVMTDEEIKKLFMKEFEKYMDALKKEGLRKFNEHLDLLIEHGQLREDEYNDSWYCVMEDVLEWDI